ncbi:retinol dehydrogenase 5-like [Amblyomma americanum]
MRTSWTLFVLFALLLWNSWDFVPFLQGLGSVVGTVAIILFAARWLARLTWKVLFVKHLPSDGKSVLVTGCGNGIGRALAKRLSREGFLVFAGCRDSQCEGAKELSQLKNIRVLQLDVTRDEEVEEAFSIVKRELGSRVLWSVVANAGVRNDGLLEWMTMDSIIKVFNVNVFGTLRVTKKFLPMLKKSKGRMIVIGSPFGHFTMPLGVAYCMTKHALVSMVDGLRRECRGKGVDFINIEPAAYKTRMTANLGDPGLVQQDWQQQSAEVTAHYSKAEIRRWSRLPRLIYDIIERENLEEVVDQIMLAIRETDPKTCYISPWLFGNFMSHVPRILPTELADLAIGTIVTRVPFVLRLAGYGAKKSK